MVIVKIEDNYIEVIALDKTKGKVHQLFHKYNYSINCEEPKESVISEDSYAQLNTKITIELFDNLVKSRKTIDKLSKDKLEELIKSYYEYQNENIIDEERIVYMTKEELIKLNEELDN